MKIAVFYFLLAMLLIWAGREIGYEMGVRSTTLISCGES